MSLECSGTGYHLVDHACRYCAGRILQCGDTYRCGGCGAVTMGSPREICGCGMLASWAPKGTQPFKCVRNPEKSDKSPSEVVILFGDPTAPPARHVDTSLARRAA